MYCPLVGDYLGDLTPELGKDCKQLIFSWTGQIILLKDKLSPDFCHGFFWSEEDVDLNYFPTQDGVWMLVCLWILLGQMLVLIDFMADVKPFFICLLSWQMLLPRTVADLIPLFVWADVIALIYIWGGNIPLLADVGPILLNNILADVIAKFYGRSYYQFLFWADVIEWIIYK